MGRWKRFRRRYECFLTSRRYSRCLIYDRVQRKTVPEGVVTLWDDFVRANCGEISSAGKNDRNFQIGDQLILKEWNKEGFTGRSYQSEITYITDYMQKNGYVVLGIRVGEFVP